jgi:hypothetical protein
MLNDRTCSSSGSMPSHEILAVSVAIAMAVASRATSTAV